MLADHHSLCDLYTIRSVHSLHRKQLSVIFHLKRLDSKTFLSDHCFSQLDVVIIQTQLRRRKGPGDMGGNEARGPQERYQNGEPRKPCVRRRPQVAQSHSRPAVRWKREESRSPRNSGQEMTSRILHSCLKCSRLYCTFFRAGMWVGKFNNSYKVCK